MAWQFKLQMCVVLSTIESKFIVIAGKELLCMKRFMQEVSFQQERYALFCNSQSAIHLGKNPNFHVRSKHIDVRYH